MAEFQRFIGFEGIDGSGKGTQWKRALERLEERDIRATGFDYPRYGKASAIVIEMYLRGELGLDLSPRVASTFYANDRLASAPEILAVLDAGGIALTNRFTLSNAAFQGCMIPNKDERISFYNWLFNLEQGLMGIPEPATSLYLRIDPALSHENVDRKGKRDYVEGRDIIEADMPRLIRARDVYDELAELYPGKLTVIDCMGEAGRMLPEEVIGNLIEKKILEITGEEQ